MRISMGIASLALVTALAAPPLAWAQSTGSGSAPDSSVPSPGPTHSPSASPASPASDFVGRHTMTGEVTKVDANTGKFSLKTGEGTLELHAPASALAGVKPGDRMSVEIAVKPAM